MKKYNTLFEIDRMTNNQLIEYKQRMSKRAVELQEEIKEFGAAWKYCIKEMHKRIEDIQYDILEIEDIRLSDNVPYNTHYLDLQ